MLDRAEAESLVQRLPPDVMFGTSTWTYPGWKGLVYEDYPAKRTAADALKEYAQYPLFRTVGIDSFFYRPPDQRTLESYASALPPGFKCVSKVWKRITSLTYKEGQLRSDGMNADWLHPGIFVNEVLGPMQEFFSEMWKSTKMAL